MKKSPEETVRELMRKTAREAGQAESLMLNCLGDMTLRMLAQKEPVTLESLLERCLRLRAECEKGSDYEADPQWHLFGALLARLQNLKESQGA